MRAYVALSVVNPWLLWSLVMIAIVAAGVGPLASWRNTSRLSRALLVAVVAAAGLFVFVGFDCSIFGGWVPDWLCFQIA